MPPHAGPRARDARRGGGVPPRPRPPHAHDRLGAPEPVRGVPRGAVRARRAPVSASGRRRSSPGSGSSARAAISSSRSTAARASSSPTRSRRCSTRSAAPSSRGWRRRTRAGRGCCATSPTPARPSSRTSRPSSALTPKELKSLRSPLERCGAVVARSIVYEEPHRHTSLLARWDQVHPEPSGASDPRQALGDLVCAGVRAAVVAPERELGALVLLAVVLGRRPRRRARRRRTARPRRRPRRGRRLSGRRCYTRRTTFHRFGEMGLRAHFL